MSSITCHYQEISSRKWVPTVARHKPHYCRDKIATVRDWRVDLPKTYFLEKHTDEEWITYPLLDNLGSSHHLQLTQLRHHLNMGFLAMSIFPLTMLSMLQQNRQSPSLESLTNLQSQLLITEITTAPSYLNRGKLFGKINMATNSSPSKKTPPLGPLLTEPQDENNLYFLA